MSESVAAAQRRRRSRRRSGSLVLVLMLVALGTLYGALASTGRAAPTVADPDAIARGRALFLVGCSSCHGLNAQGSSVAPSLIGVGAAAVDFQVGTGRMPLMRQGAEADRKRPRFTQAQIDDMAAYIASLSGGPNMPTAEQLDLSRGDVANGGELFRANCAQCHNFNGSGGALTSGKYAPSLNGVSAKHIYEAMLTGPENMPVYGDDQLTPQEKLDIIRFLKQTHTEASPGGLDLGRVGPVSEGLVIWVVGTMALVLATVWIGARI